MNPLNWKRDHQIAFLIAVLLGLGMGAYIGQRQLDPSTSGYWLHIGLWGIAGAVLAGAGAYIRQLMRNTNSD